MRTYFHGSKMQTVNTMFIVDIYDMIYDQTATLF